MSKKSSTFARFFQKAMLNDQMENAVNAAKLTCYMLLWR